MIKLVKRLNVTARRAHVLLRETLLSVGWLDIDTDPGTGSFGLVDSGSDGETDASAPQTFTAASAAFSGANVGQYLVLGTNAPFGMKGIHKIVAVTSATTVNVASGLYGSQFSTGLNLGWRLVDPTLNTGITEFVVQSPGGTGAPAWQARFFIGGAENAVINIEVGPFGGWSNGSGWLEPIVTPKVITQDSTPMWYFSVDDTQCQLWTEANSGADLFEMAYVGTGTANRPDLDDHFAVCYAGAIPASLATVASLAADGSTKVNYQVLNYVDPTAGNMFLNLPNSPFDLRRDLAAIALGCIAVGYVQGDRGILNNTAFVSTLVPYRTFVDNGRSWLSLGSGIAVSWDGSVAT